jgi:hypothetical protein
VKKYLLLLSLLISTNTFALEYIRGKVVILEPTYLPGTITFQLDNGNATCPKGRWLKWAKTEENNKAVYATLMAALASGKSINFIINDNDTQCKGQYLHLLSQ